MKPDRVIGLRPTSRINHCIAAAPRHLSHCPIRGRNIVYPFLVIEAKKEEDAPGFRAIQKQTAFPVRRLLQAQNDLRSVCGVDCEPFLVWFFAYQGEEWRLYAGTLESPKVVSLRGSEMATSRRNRMLTCTITAYLRFMARYDRVTGWCSSVTAHRRLYMVMGQRYLSTRYHELSSWAQYGAQRALSSHNGSLSLFPVCTY